MKKKYIKILVATLVLIIGVSISINVNAGYELFKNEAITYKKYDGDIANKYFKGTKTRIGQHTSGDNGSALLFCVQGMQNYTASLTRELITKSDGSQFEEGSTSETKIGSYPSIPTNANGEQIDGHTTMVYERDAYTEITDQAFAYLIATAQERGILNKMYTQYAVWALDINEGRKEEPNALATEAMNYKIFYESIHNKKGEDKFKITNNSSEEIDVGIDASKKEYTIGNFEVSYPVGTPNAKVEKGTDGSVDDEDDQTFDSEKEILESILEQSQIIYEHIGKNRTVSGSNVAYNSNIGFKKTNIEAYYKLHEEIASNYENYKVNQIISSQKKLKEAVENLIVKEDAKTLNNAISDIEKEKANLNKKIEDLNNEINKLKEDLKNATSQSKKDKIQSDLEQKQSELEQNQSDLEQNQKKLEQKQDRLKAVKARDNINNIKLEPEEATSSDNKITDAAVQFSYITEVTVVGCDEKGNEIREIASNKIEDGKMQKEMSIVDVAGNEIEHNITYKDGTKIENANLPNSEEVFWVRFDMGDKNNDNAIKKIKIKVKTDYLEHCEGSFHYYTGTWYTWKWEIRSELDHVKETPCPGKPAFTIEGEHKHTEDIYRYWYVLTKTPSGTPQKYLGIDFAEGGSESGKVQAKKEWNQKEIYLKGPDDDEDFEITMELGGYVWIDQDNGKVDTGNSLLDDLSNNAQNEVLPGAEVWLYEYNGLNKDGEPNDSDDPCGIQLTDENGHYLFTGLNAEKKYYVKFVYNGMMYDNVTYNLGNPVYNSEDWKKTSKAEEINRQDFNNKFAEIGSYPSNYEIPKENKMFDDIGDYNITFPQEEIEDVFKELSRIMAKNGDGNLKRACDEVAGNDPSEMTRRKVQFAVDCRMSARTDTKQKQFNGADNTYVYPVYNNFTITKEATNENDKPISIAGKEYNLIYPGQRYINYGIKARGTVDLALYKDVTKIDVSINGKNETYNYGEVQTATVGVREIDYLNGLRNAYRSDSEYENTERTRNMENDEYKLYTRKEEITNGVSIDKGEGGIDYNLNDTERLNIDITYKIEIVNQSNTFSAVTEIVDYYDKNYVFKSAYVEYKENDEIKKIPISKTDGSYGNNTKYKNDDKYQTMYLTPRTADGATIILGNNEVLDIYVTFTLKNENEDAGKLLNRVLINEKKEELRTMNLAEINGYKTYYSKGYTDKTGNKDNTPGLIDIDSNPGNLNLNLLANFNELVDIDTIVNEVVKKENDKYKDDYNKLKEMYEDDTWRARAIGITYPDSRTLSGTVFEDKTDYNWDDKTINTGTARTGNGQLDDQVDRVIEGVKVELLEIKDVNNDGTEEMTVRSTTTTKDNGSYEFTGFLPGNYTIKYIYGSDDNTVLIPQDPNATNKTSYNGQDYQSTIYKEENRFTDANGNIVYWYKDDIDGNKKYSDAKDDQTRVQEVIDYSKKEDGDDDDKTTKEIINHKANVFNSYISGQGRDSNKLVEELEERTYRYAYTPEIKVEVEYATQTTEGNKAKKDYAHNITEIDFGIVERPRSELVIDQDIARIKVVAADGVTVLFDSTGPTSNLQWIEGTKIEAGTKHYRGGTINGYEKQELVNIIMDEELISGAKLEVTYRFTVTNNSESDTWNGKDVTTKAKNIINYVSNNLTFDDVANKDTSGNSKWTVVKAEKIQNSDNSTFISNAEINSQKEVDLSTQAVILQTTENNNLTRELKPKESTTEELVLTKVLSAESTLDDLTYTNLAEIVEIDNTVGRYDHGATPGNQSIESNPTEHDAAGASKYDTISEGGGTPDNPPDGVIIITPPTGSNYIYYAIGITSAVILAAGIYLIKKFVIDRK